MDAMVDQLTSADAARQLGVGVRQVERLVASGDLIRAGTVGRVLLVDAVSVHRLRERGVAKGRPWSDETVRAALELLRSGTTDRLAGTQRSRLRSKLRGLTAQELVRVTRRRAEVFSYRASTSFLQELRNHVVLTGAAAVDADRATAGQFGLGTAQRDIVDGYVGHAAAAKLVERYLLTQDTKGNVTLRATGDLPHGSVADSVTVALDLAESLDARERSAGLAYLGERLAALT